MGARHWARNGQRLRRHAWAVRRALAREYSHEGKADHRHFERGARPRILFGSAARGEMGPDSDVDLLVVKRGVIDRGRLSEDIHLRFFGLAVSVDVLVVTPEDVEHHRDRIGSVIGPAVREGREVYAAPR